MRLLGHRALEVLGGAGRLASWLPYRFDSQLDLLPASPAEGVKSLAPMGASLGMLVYLDFFGPGRYDTIVIEVVSAPRRRVAYPAFAARWYPTTYHEAV